ncbi:WD40 repeat-like protein, partial [Ramaria rubella]
YQARHTLVGHTREVTTLRFNHDAKLLASGSSDNRVKIWSTRTGRCLQTITNHVHGPVTDIVWFRNKQGQLAFFFSCADGTVHLYIQVSEPYYTTAVAICAHRSAVESIDYDPIHRRLASSGSGEAKVWNVNADCE